MSRGVSKNGGERCILKRYNGGMEYHPLRSLRLSRKISQEALAVRLGVKKDAISKWETNKTRISIDKAKQIAAVLGCTVMDLLGEATPFDQVGPLTPEEQAHVLILRELAEDERRAVFTLAHASAQPRRKGRRKAG